MQAIDLESSGGATTATTTSTTGANANADGEREDERPIQLTKRQLNWILYGQKKNTSMAMKALLFMLLLLLEYLSIVNHGWSLPHTAIMIMWYFFTSVLVETYVVGSSSFANGLNSAVCWASGKRE